LQNIHFRGYFDIIDSLSRPWRSLMIVSRLLGASWYFLLDNEQGKKLSKTTIITLGR